MIAGLFDAYSLLEIGTHMPSSVGVVETAFSKKKLNEIYHKINENVRIPERRRFVSRVKEKHFCYFVGF